ncbi:hypothetical protein BH18ACT12_BH18ACT12_15840 [soil metagenome]
MATTEAIDVVMPQMGVSVSEGTITKWLKQQGEQVEADEALLEISTDKVDTEVPSPGSGVLTEILVQEGETVEVGTKLAVIGGDGVGTASGSEQQSQEAAPPEPATPAAADASMAAASEGVGDGAPSKQQPVEPAEATQEAQAASEGVGEGAPSKQQPVEPAEATQEAQAATNGKTFVSPVVAKIASEHGVDPSQVQGTGRGGRVTKKDILAFIDTGAPQKAEPQPEAAAAVPQAPPAPAAPSPAAQPQQPSVGEGFEPMTAMRKGIAEHMRRSLDTSAHVTSAIEVDMSKVSAIRAKLKKEYQQSYGVNPTYLIFVARAAAETLREYPWINGEIRDDQIVTRSYVNLGFAVELQDGKGLIVPVVKNAETLNLLGMAKAVTDIAQRARDKKLMPDEVQGGTLTITNPGGYGTFHGTPVISQPQAAILGTYAVVKRPWVIQDDMGEDVIAIRPIMNLTLTYDHRLVDGALAGRFLRDLREKLQTWDELAY